MTTLFFGMTLYAQEPGNNLRKTLAQLKQSFPNVFYLQNEKGYNVYKSDGDDRDFTCFYLNNDRVVGEYTYIFSYNTLFIRDLYYSLLNRFASYGGKHWKTTSGYDITYFRYSYFTVKVANYGDQLQLYYELNGLNIEISPLVERHLR